MYPFDISITIIPFPKKKETPKFDKHKGRGDPKDHLKYFYIECKEVSYIDSYLFKIFPRRLGGQATDLFTHLPHGTITTFFELANKFVTHFSYNIQNDITIMDISNTKK